MSSYLESRVESIQRLLRAQKVFLAQQKENYTQGRELLTDISQSVV